MPAINDTLTAHRGGCELCTPTSRDGCPVLGLVAVSLDLVIYSRHSTNPAPAVPPRDLYAAVRSRRLSTAEAATLDEVLGILDLAVAQVDAAGINLPRLAGIGIAAVDSYRAATTPSR